MLVLAVWVVVAVSVVIVAKSVGSETNDDLRLPVPTARWRPTCSTTSSQAGQRLGPHRLPRPSRRQALRTQVQEAIQRVVKAYSKDPATTKVTGPFSEQGSSQLNKKKTIGYISLNLEDSASQLNAEKAQRIIDVAEPLDKAGLKPAAGATSARRSPSHRRSSR